MSGTKEKLKTMSVMKSQKKKKKSLEPGVGEMSYFLKKNRRLFSMSSEYSGDKLCTSLTEEEFRIR